MIVSKFRLPQPITFSFKNISLTENTFLLKQTKILVVRSIPVNQVTNIFVHVFLDKKNNDYVDNRVTGTSFNAYQLTGINPEAF